MLAFVVNPVSGNGKGRKVWVQVESALQAGREPFVVHFTQQAGDARQYAGKLCAEGGYRCIIAVGGDGTANEVIHGLYASKSQAVFGYIPAGSGNDFARGHGLPLQPLKALEFILSNPPPQSMDLFSLGERGIAASSIGVGFDATVAQMTNSAPYKKWLNRLNLGFLSYVITVIRALFTYQPVHSEIFIDGQSYQYANVWLISINNIPFIGGGMKICPDASPNDGLAEICVVHSINRFELLRVFPLVYSGKHIRHPAVRFHRGQRISVRPALKLDVHADGEDAESTPLDVSVLTVCLRVVKPTN